ncbi:MAG TPA: cytochrome c [Candidatus Eremiobacteraceae bacterium]|nr:cytochrome c [Candidatus Eremiobacteraceae bacterium]
MQHFSVRPVAFVIVAASILACGAQALRPHPAQAIPMFAKRTGASCELCHTVFPGMTTYGMMVMMSDFSALPYHAGENPGFVSVVLSEQYLSNPDGDPPPPKLFTDNLGLLSGGFVGPNFTYYLEQHIVDGGFVGGTDQLWVSYNQLFRGAGDLQVGKFHTPFPFMPAHRITISPYATTSYTVGSNDFNEDDSHWGVTLAQMQGTLMYSLSALGGNQLICQPGCAQLGGTNTNHSLDFSAMSMSDNPFNYGLGIIYNGFTPSTAGPIDRFDRSAVYLQYTPPGLRRLQFQALGQIGWDSNPNGDGAGIHTQGFFTEAQYDFTHGNWGVLRWDSQNGESPVAGLTLDLIHQFAPNFKLTVEGRALTTGTTMGVGLEWAGPWSRHNILPSPVLGSMPGMNMSGMDMSNMSNMPAMNAMAPSNGPSAPLSPLDTTLSHGDAVAGENLFKADNCAACHGAAGVGGGIGPKLAGSASQVSPNEMYERIKHPMPPMPDFKLSDGDIANLVAYVVTLTPGQTVAAEIAKAHAQTNAMSGMNMSGMNMKGMQMSMAQPPPVYPQDQPPQDAGGFAYYPGVETGDPVRGGRLFAQDCARCHAATGQGISGSGPAIDDMGAHFTPSHIAWHIHQHDAVSPPLQLSDKDVIDLTAFLETLGVK